MNQVYQALNTLQPGEYTSWKNPDSQLTTRFRIKKAFIDQGTQCRLIHIVTLSPAQISGTDNTPSGMDYTLCLYPDKETGKKAWKVRQS